MQTLLATVRLPSPRLGGSSELSSKLLAPSPGPLLASASAPLRALGPPPASGEATGAASGEATSGGAGTGESARAYVGSSCAIQSPRDIEDIVACGPCFWRRQPPHMSSSCAVASAARFSTSAIEPSTYSTSVLFVQLGIVQRYGATLCLRRERRRAELAASGAARLRCVRRAGKARDRCAPPFSIDVNAALTSIEPSFARFGFGSAFVEIRLLRRAATRGKVSLSDATP